MNFPGLGLTEPIQVTMSNPFILHGTNDEAQRLPNIFNSLLNPLQQDEPINLSDNESDAQTDVQILASIKNCLSISPNWQLYPEPSQPILGQNLPAQPLPGILKNKL